MLVWRLSADNICAVPCHVVLRLAVLLCCHTSQPYRGQGREQALNSSAAHKTFASCPFVVLLYINHKLRNAIITQQSFKQLQKRCIPCVLWIYDGTKTGMKRLRRKREATLLTPDMPSRFVRR